MKIPKVDILLLDSEIKSWPELKDLIGESKSWVLQTQKSSYDPRSIVGTMYLAIRYHIRPGFAVLASVSKRSGARVLLATEGGHREVQAALSRLMPKLPQILVSHGSVRVDNINHAKYPLVGDCETVVAWGVADLDTYARSGFPTPRIVVAGSLRNACYFRLYRNGRGPEEKLYPISLVSKFADDKEESEHNPVRSHVLKLLKTHLARYCKERNLPIRILLRPDLSGNMLPGAREREIEHFKQIFSDVSISFSDASRLYTTYLESDQSDVTIGVPSGSLTESFARGNKVLMIGQNPSSGDYLGFPREGRYLLYEPEYEVFAERLDEIREMSTRDFADEFAADREYVVANATSDKTIDILSQLIREQVSRIQM
jgi:hypothetical protein